MLAFFTSFVSSINGLKLNRFFPSHGVNLSDDKAEGKNKQEECNRAGVTGIEGHKGLLVHIGGEHFTVVDRPDFICNLCAMNV